AAVWAGLLFSFSQSSFVALAAGVVLAAAVAWGRRALLVVAVGAVVFLLAVAVAPRVRHAVLHHSNGGINRVTSGRSRLVSNGIKIALHHPFVGVGIARLRPPPPQPPPPPPPHPTAPPPPP